MKKEKLLLIGAGFNSRPIGLFLSLFLLSILAAESLAFYKVIFQPGESLDFGGFKFNTRTIECSGSRDALYEVKMERYKFTNQVSDLPANCSAKEEKSASPWLLGIFIFITVIFLSFSIPYKKIILKGDFLVVYKGNVFFSGRKNFLLSQLRQIVFFRQKIKPLLWFPYEILALQISGEKESVNFPTRISLLKHEMKIAENAIGQFKRTFEAYPQIQISSEIS